MPNSINIPLFDDDERWDLVCKSVLDYYDKCYEYEKVGKTNIKLLDLTDKKYDESILELSLIHI